jgi:enamine deaminase RidA (YjgF/YER057c/UK114 family)
VEEMTLRELQRVVEDQGRRFADYVRADVYTRDHREVTTDMSEIRASQDRTEIKLSRLQSSMVAALAALVVNLIVQLAQSQ